MFEHSRSNTEYTQSTFALTAIGMCNGSGPTTRVPRCLQSPDQLFWKCSAFILFYFICVASEFYLIWHFFIYFSFLHGKREGNEETRESRQWIHITTWTYSRDPSTLSCPIIYSMPQYYSPMIGIVKLFCCTVSGLIFFTINTRNTFPVLICLFPIRLKLQEFSLLKESILWKPIKTSGLVDFLFKSFH